MVAPPKLVGVVTIRAWGPGGQFVWMGDDGILRATAPPTPGRERFTLYRLFNGRWALQAANGLYVTAEDQGASPLIANRWGIGEWESFYLVEGFFANGKVGIQSMANGRYLGVRWTETEGRPNGDFAIIADHVSLDIWAEFLIEYL